MLRLTSIKEKGNKDMKYAEDYEKLGMPKDFKFGIELEAYNVKTKGKESLYTGESAEYIKSKKWHMATKKEEMLVGKGGAELVSPILTDTPEDYKNIARMCEQMKKYPGKDGDRVVADSKCGLHIHFDSECLTKDTKRMENFKKLYAESEELLYKMCNDKNDPIREKAINKDFRGIHFISAVWRNGMAAPSGKKILKQIEAGTLKVSYKKFGKLRTLASKYKLDERRYEGLNLTNIGNAKKNTIEFRMANGTLEPEVIKQTIFLYSSLINTAIQITENPENYEKKLKEFYQTDISEEQKAKYFLNLIMESPDDREIYMDRWKSVKDAKVFARNEQKGFAQGRFKREQFTRIAQRTPGILVKQMYGQINQILSKTKEEGDKENDR